LEFRGSPVTVGSGRRNVLTRDAAAESLPASPLAVHRLYGIRIKTPWPVTGVAREHGDCDVEFVEGDTTMLADAASHVPAEQRQRWAQYAALPDGSSYRRWSGLFEFLVTPDARCIHARTLNQTNEEALLAYLLVDALSFSMVRLGREPLHATAVLTPHGVVAFLGESGDGKSTLGALLVRHGFRLVTDDMLVLTFDADECVAHAGPPRIKLYRHVANRIFDAGYSGVPMNPVTEKLIIPLNHDQSVNRPHPLRAIYLIQAHHHGGAVRAPGIRQLSPAVAFPQVLAATASHYAFERERLARQFNFLTRLLEKVPVKTLEYPRDENSMATLRDTVLADLDRVVN
jgi:hypothetical protein